jgi:hypothetical protein
VERSAGQADVREHLDARRDVPVPEAEAPDLHQEDEHLPASSAWDASDGAHPVATGAADLRLASSDEDAEKWAVPALDVLAQDASSPLVHQSAQRARQGEVVELYTPDAVQSAEQSFAALEAAAGLQVQPDELGPQEPEERRML